MRSGWRDEPVLFARSQRERVLHEPPRANGYVYDNACTTCVGVTNGQYFVAPQVGSDETGTGIGTVSGCQFKTMTHALQIIGNHPSPGTILDVQYILGAGETFPIVIPSNVTLVTHGPFATINVPSGKAGIVLSGPGSAIDGRYRATLTVSGFADAGSLYGVVVQGAGTRIRTAVTGSGSMRVRTSSCAAVGPSSTEVPACGSPRSGVPTARMTFVRDRSGRELLDDEFVPRDRVDVYALVVAIGCDDGTCLHLIRGEYLERKRREGRCGCSSCCYC